MRRRHLIIMVKEPRPGRVKTRLGATIGMTSAAWWFRHQAHRMIRQVGRDPRWSCTLAVSPDHDGMASRVWPGDITRIEQGNGDLGARMARLLQSVGPGPKLLVGADIPRLQKQHIVAGFEALRCHDAVLGPASDGGFWMVGLKGGSHPVPSTLFDNVRWSTADTLSDTLKSFGDFSVAQTSVLDDVDTLEDLFRLKPS